VKELPLLAEIFGGREVYFGNEQRQWLKDRRTTMGVGLKK
jgi:hypothetical protein